MKTSISRRRTFGELRTAGRRVRHGSVRMSYVQLEEGLAAGPAAVNTGRGPEVAFAIGKPFGNAVTRNRGRRRLRDAFTHAWQAQTDERQVELHGAYLLTGNRGLLHASFSSLVEDVSVCLGRLATTR